MNDDYARGKCPICGCETLYRKNKNGILYTFCRNGHHAKLGRDDSKKATAMIAGCKNWNNGIVYLYPLEMKGKEDGKNDRNSTGTGARAELVPGTDANTRAVSASSGTTVSTTTGTGSSNKSDESADITGWL